MATPRNSTAAEKLRDDRSTGTRDGTVQYRTAAVRAPFIFGKWARLHGFDLLTMAVLGAIALGVYFAKPAPKRSFPLYNIDGSVVWPQFAYPLRKEILPIWACALIAFFVPFVFIMLFQIRRKSVDDVLTSTVGLLQSLITAATFQVFIKWLVGGLRPHFYAVCQPNVSQGGLGWNGFNNLMFNRDICTGDPDQIDDALESMPSGHATAAWAGLLYLSLYFNAQLKVISAHNPAYWKMILFFAPLLGATLISGALTIDAYHNWYDLVVGGIIGSSCALVAFRQTFASVFDFRFNHILLPRATSLFHRQLYLPLSAGSPYYSYTPSPRFESHDLPFTREGGWSEAGLEQATGAPGDATVLGTGIQGGGNLISKPRSSFGHHQANSNGIGARSPIGNNPPAVGHQAV